MSRMKSLFAVLCLAAAANVAVPAHAQVTLKVMIAGSSAFWQAVAVGTYKAGACPTGSLAGCRHYTNSTFNLNDTRPTLKTGGTTVTDTGNVWIVWDNATADPNCATACDVWAYLSAGGEAGTRCYFAQPHCNVNHAAPFPAAGNIISSAVWGADTTPPTTIQNLFTASSGVLVNVGAIDIRPEDALFAHCRVNAELGYGPGPPGTCSDLIGTPIKGPGNSVANNVAYNISGVDPFSGTTIPSSTVVAVGAVPIVFITNRQGALAGVTDASLTQLDTVFPGLNCTGNVFNLGTAGNIDVYLQDPLSGSMNVAEYTAFRFPRDANGHYAGQSQETGINPANANNNPLNLPCTAGGSRLRAIGTDQEVSEVQTSNSARGVDGIGYVLFNYENLSPLADNGNYAYLTINSIDPIFAIAGSKHDPGQPTQTPPNELPGIADLPASCAGAFPCSETVIWKGKLSFPNVRNGSYRQWSIVRLISNNPTGCTGSGCFLNNVKALVTSTQQSAVTTVPDFIPAVKTLTDPGLQLYRSHYSQESVAPKNGIAGDKGGDEGGCIIPAGSGDTKIVQREFGCVAGP